MEIKWFAFKNDYSYKEYNSLTNIRCKFWLRMTERTTYTTMYKNTYIIYQYSVLDKKERKYVIKRGGWEIAILQDQYPKHAHARDLMVTIRDPLGNYRNRFFDVEERGLHHALYFLDRVSRFQDWKHFEKIESLEATDLFKNLKNEIDLLLMNKKINHVEFDLKLRKKLKRLKLTMDFYNHWLK